MKNKENCEIIKDLLPNYIDDLASEETKKFVEEHLKNCKECNKVFENMKADIEKEKQKIKKEVKYAKKYNRKIKTLIFIIVLIFLVIFSLTFVRNAIIIKSLISKAEKYDNSNNCHTTWTSYSKENMVIMETYYKDGKYYSRVLNYSPRILNIEENEESPFTKDEIYYDGKNEAWFRNDELVSYEEKEDPNNFVFLPKNFAQIKMYDHDLLTFIFSCATKQISSEKINGEECYRLKGYFVDEATYIDKKTGLSKGAKSGFSNDLGYMIQYSDVTFEFDIVTDEDVTMPNIE